MSAPANKKPRKAIHTHAWRSSPAISGAAMSRRCTLCGLIQWRDMECDKLGPWYKALF